ncbi:c-type cytochrome domain-containing protein [Bacteroidota bacterium]
MLKRIKKYRLIFFCIILISGYVGCDDTLTPNDVDNRVIPDSNVSFSKDISPVFELKCISCHGNGRYDASLDLTNPSRFVDGLIVVPGTPETSILVWRIDPKYGTDPMPPINSAYLPLTQNQIRGVVTWIDEGAKNN